MDFNVIKGMLAEYDNIQFAFVFGSYAKDKQTSNSDLDIGVMFEKPLENLDEYLKLKMELSEITGVEVDIAVLNDAAPLLKKQALHEGIQIYAKSQSFVNEQRIKALFEYDDMEKYLENSYQALSRKYM